MRYKLESWYSIMQRIKTIAPPKSYKYVRIAGATNVSWRLHKQRVERKTKFIILKCVRP